MGFARSEGCVMRVSVSDDLVSEAQHVIKVLEGIRGLSLTKQVDCVLGGAIKKLRDQIQGNCPGLDDQEKAFVEDNSAIQAIKHYRERTGHDLRTSKGVVDAYREHFRNQNPRLYHYHKLWNQARYYLGHCVAGTAPGIDAMDDWDNLVRRWWTNGYITMDVQEELLGMIQRVRDCE